MRAFLGEGGAKGRLVPNFAGRAVLAPAPVPLLGQRTIVIDSERALPVFPAASVGVARRT